MHFDEPGSEVERRSDQENKCMDQKERSRTVGQNSVELAVQKYREGQGGHTDDMT